MAGRSGSRSASQVTACPIGICMVGNVGEVWARARPQATRRGPPTLRPVAAAFVLLGIFWGTWAVAAADAERFLGLDHGGFGLLLSAAVAAGAAASAAAGPVAERIG